MSKQAQTTKICIITNAPISQNPRVVKEANALAQAGYKVSVLYVEHDAWTSELDAGISQSSVWKARVITLSNSSRIGKLARYLVALRSHLFRMLANISFKAYVAEIAFCRVFFEQLFMALQENADLYIAHNPQALPIAAMAARVHKVKYAFDSEDFHTGEYATEERTSLDYRMLEFLERKYLPACSYISASSLGIAQELSKKYGVNEPAVVLNVFPVADREGLPAATGMQNEQVSTTLKLYWFSQIISLDRGLSDAIKAISLLKDVELHIRGHLRATEKNELTAMMESTNTAHRVFIHDPVPPWALLKSIVQFDVGLCLEVPDTLNRDICITNKLFLYLLAGLPIVATETRGQLEVLSKYPAVGFVYKSGDYHALANLLKQFVAAPKRMLRAGKAGLAASLGSLNWEMEQRKLLASVRAAIG